MTAATFPGRDRGETSIQTILLVPVVLGILFVVVHAAALAHAGQVASLAANRGAQLAASADGTSTSNFFVRQEIQRTISELGNTLESAPQITAYGGTVNVSVRISVSRIVPFLPHTVRRNASAPFERFVEEQDR